MPSSGLIFPLAKFIAAAAWADGFLDLDEVNSLKEWLVRTTEMSGEDWQRLQMFLDHPVGADELELLFAAALQEVRSDEDKTFLRQCLLDMVCADSKVSATEQALIEQVDNALEELSTSPAARIAKLIQGALDRRRPSPVGREEYFSDYIHNPVYYYLTQGQGIPMKETPELRKLSLVAGLLAHAGKADLDMSVAESTVLAEVLCDDWTCTSTLAARIAAAAQVAAGKGYDTQRVLHAFLDISDREERLRLLRGSFRIANAEHGTCAREIEAIRVMAEMLHLSHREFIDAKLTVPRSDRQGL